MNAQPVFNRSHRTHPFVGGLGDASAMLMPGKNPECGQSGSFCLSHRGRRVRRRLFGRQTFYQSPRFLIVADRGDLEDRPAVTGLDEALIVAHVSAMTVNLIRLVQNSPLVDGAVEQVKKSIVPVGRRRQRLAKR